MDGKQDTGPLALKRAAFVILAWAGSYTLAMQLLKHHPVSVWMRGGAVALAVLGFLLWLGGTARAIHGGNEFTRQIHLVALACGFAATALFIFVCDMLQRAGFIDYISFMTLFLVMMGAWLLAVALATLYYR
jgi:hypothetical protein